MLVTTRGVLLGLASVTLLSIVGVGVANTPSAAAPLAAGGAAALALIPLRRVWPRLGVILCVAAAVLGERLVLVVSGTGGNGVLAGGFLLTFYAAAMSWRSADARRAWTMLTSKGLPALAWLLAGVVLPVVGVLAGYPLRTVAASLVPLGSFAALVTGAASSLRGIDVGVTVRRALAPLLAVSAAVGLVQFLYFRGVALPGSDALVNYLAVGAEAAGRQLVYSRASGLYWNPNTLSALGGIGILLGAHWRTEQWSSRLALGVPGLILVLIGQSRIAVVATALGLLVTAFGRAEAARRSRHPLTTAISVGSVAALALATVDRLAPTITSSFGARVARLWGVGDVAPGLDSSLSGRLAFWSSALETALGKPFGTFGPPQMATGHSIDSEYVQVLVQGGLMYLALLIWLLVRTAAVAVDSDGVLPVSFVVFAAVMGFAGPILGILPALILWLLFGSALVEAQGRSSVRTEVQSSVDVAE